MIAVSILVIATNYLDIKGLLDLTCQTVADMIKASRGRLQKRFASISTSRMTILQRKKRRCGGRINGRLSEAKGCLFNVDNVNGSGGTRKLYLGGRKIMKYF
ncbi:putative SKP1 component, dimerization [Rosa chinensis]|uniref:Putative SKP1 component, dimerization n=1 Tax=Rosa chinensis TaxID=74649 RepID=A0A2P6PKX6_ROSCH|nr:putative SKP1 component, dimerization [Rosa chinensis]